MDNNNYRLCSQCGVGFYYMDSPPPAVCFCGGTLREPSEEEYIEIINRRIDVNYPTCSC